MHAHCSQAIELHSVKFKLAVNRCTSSWNFLASVMKRNLKREEIDLGLKR